MLQSLTTRSENRPRHQHKAQFYWPDVTVSFFFISYFSLLHIFIFLPFLIPSYPLTHFHFSVSPPLAYFPPLVYWCPPPSVQWEADGKLTLLNHCASFNLYLPCICSFAGDKWGYRQLGERLIHPNWRNFFHVSLAFFPLFNQLRWCGKWPMSVCRELLQEIGFLTQRLRWDETESCLNTRSHLTIS